MFQFNSLLSLCWGIFQKSHAMSLLPLTATLLTFFGAAILSYLWQVRAATGRLTFKGLVEIAFPNDTWKTASVRTDLIMYVVGKVIRGVLAVGDLIVLMSIAGSVAWALGRFFPEFITLKPGAGAFILWAIILFVVGDFANFLSHFLQHKVGFLWELHKVHHSATFLNPLTTARMHPLGDKFDHLVAAALTGIPAGVAVFLYGFQVVDLGVMMAVANLFGTILVLDALRHSHFPVSFGWLDRILVSPHMHQLHHSARFAEWDLNMGNKLSIWDWMFGMARIPEKNAKMPYGIGRGGAYDQQYSSVYGAYVRPIIDMMKVLSGKAGVLPDPEFVDPLDAARESEKGHGELPEGNRAPALFLSISDGV